MIFVPVVGRQGDAPDVDGLIELNAIVRRVLGIDVNDAGATLFTGEVDVDDDLHARLEFVGT